MEASSVNPGQGEGEAQPTTPGGQPIPQFTPEQLGELIQAQHDQRAELAALRDELAQAKRQAAIPTAPAEFDPEKLRQARLQVLSEHEFYCPGCGNVGDYPQKCQGRSEAPHPALEMVSTDEVKNAPDPQTDPSGYKEWQSHHTAAPYTTPEGVVVTP